MQTQERTKAKHKMKQQQNARKDTHRKRRNQRKKKKTLKRILRFCTTGTKTEKMKCLCVS